MKTKTLITILLLVAASVCHGQNYPDGIAGNRVLDSIVTTYASHNMSKTIYETVSDKKIVYVRYRWNSQTNVYEKAQKVDVSFYAIGKAELETTYQWNAETNAWINSSKTEYSYDNNGNNTMREELKWDAETSAWTKSKKVESLFDANGNDTLTISYYGNVSSDTWTNNARIVKAYDDSRNNTMMALFDWNGEMWEGFSFGKHEYSFDENNRVITEDVYDWSYETNSYELAIKYKTEYLGDSGGEPMQVVVSVWRDAWNMWDYSQKDTYTYDADGNTTSVVSRVWNTRVNWWDNDSEHTYTYDSNGNMIAELYSCSWNATENQWTDGYSIEYEYDIYGNKTLEARYNFNHSPATAIYYYYSDGNMQNAIEYLPLSNGQTLKFLINGQLFILRDGKTYTVQGQEVK